MIASPVGREIFQEGKYRDFSLEGEITVHGLTEVLQFLEAGKKTGLLSIEDQKPVGLIQIDQGGITFAHTYFRDGYEAVLEILSRDRGLFRFYPGKGIVERNCRLVITQILMHWAVREDEARRADLAPSSAP